MEYKFLSKDESPEPDVETNTPKFEVPKVKNQEIPLSRQNILSDYGIKDEDLEEEEEKFLTKEINVEPLKRCDKLIDEEKAKEIRSRKKKYFMSQPWDVFNFFKI